MLDYIITILKQCPFLKDVLLTADFLMDEENCLGVFASGSNPVIERYADGGRLMQFVFRLAHWGNDLRRNSTAETGFYEEIGSWLEGISHMPALDDGRVAQYFEVLKTGSLEKRDYGSDRYGMECRLIYYSEKGSDR